MTYRVCYWDATAGRQMERDATPAEAAEIDSRRTAPPPVPQVVDRRQGKQALLKAQKMALVQPAIDAIADLTKRELTQIWWDDAPNFERTNPVLIELGTAIGLSSAEIDQLFITAAKL